jgi:lipoteichoic acid synthase
MVVWLIYTGILFYMEMVFHLRFFGFQGGNPLFPLGLLLLVTSLQALVTGWFGPRGAKRAFRIMMWIQFLIFAVQTVYFTIFRQPLQLAAMLVGGQDALTNYWREALAGFLKAVPVLLLLALPILVSEVLWKLKRWRLRELEGIQKLRLGLSAWMLLLYCICCILIGDMAGADYSEEYQEYYDPETVMRNMGVIAMVQRDGFYELSNLFHREDAIPAEGTTVVQDLPQQNEPPGKEAGELEPVDLTDERTEDSAEQPPEPDVTPEPEPEEPDTSPHAWDIDLEKLGALSGDNKETTWLADYIAGQTPTNRNEYTGMFEGYNLIFLTAEGFSTYAIREDLTPTLYKMVNSSFVFPNYYVPLWQTSTSDGEYVNCTGLIPDGQFSMRKSSSINMAYSLPRFFASEGVYCRAYHNNTLSYYDRHLSHPNLGYDFKASKLGGLSQEEWGSQIFPIENPNAWPQSDYEMMQATIPEYINDERFHVYYMTVSGHMNYNFSGNQMSSRNKEAVAGLDMSENARAYIACHIELDKALAYLLEQLEQAGKLDNTVICLSADHYPYGMSQEEYEELAGKSLSSDMDLFRNSLILWNGGMQEPVVVDKACCSVDLLPTLLNLFGFDYDSRMYAGRDIFSAEEGLVIFNDKSFVTDTVAYNKKQKTTAWRTEISEEEQDAYMDRVKQDVKNRYLFSAYILRNNYYDIIRQCVPGSEE